MRLIRFLWLPVLLLTIGCSAIPLQHKVEPAPPEIRTPQPESKGWRSIRFQIHRQGDDVLWETDLLIAHRIVTPVLFDHLSEIDLWRFHRRAGNDDTGHQFSFIFYTTAAVADKVNDRVASDPIVEQLLSAGVLRKVLTAKTDRNDRPEIGNTSDPKWSTVVKDNWPYYIMGVSRMWLGMVDQVSRDIGTTDGLSQDLLSAHYKKVNEQVTNIWQQEGYHALLHHLNAIYGYEALVYWEKRWKSF